MSQRAQHRYRDGDVVLYRRPESDKWQARYKMPTGGWHRISTKHARLDDAKDVACKAYERARFRHEEGLPPVSRRFCDVARVAIAEMESAFQAGTGKSAFRDYRQAIENYLIPHFAKCYIDKIDTNAIQKFEAWRKGIMAREPAASTVLNHNAALNRVFNTAVAHGWVNQAQIPELKLTGRRSEQRPAFTEAEWQKVTANLRHWVEEASNSRNKAMRELLWDYVLFLGDTGIRTGTEAFNLKWKHIRWHTNGDGVRYLAVSVDGKTGPRELVARHYCAEVLKRIQRRFPDLAKFPFDSLLTKKREEYVFRLRNGDRTANLYKTFKQFLIDKGLLQDKNGKERTLYSLRHTYATLRLLSGELSIHQLATQLGTSVAMIERHYSHLQPLMIAPILAGRKYPTKTPPNSVST